MQGNENLGCNFFGWYDPPICNRVRQVIPDLLQKVDLLEKKVEAQKKRERKLLVVICIFMIVFLCKIV